MQTCTLPAPSARNSAASRQVVTPPIPLIGRPAISGRARNFRHHVQRNRFDRRAAIATMCALAVNRRFRREKVKINRRDRVDRVDQRSPHRATAFHRGLSRLADMSVIFGVSLTITGMRVLALTQRVTISMYSGTCPTALPIPRSDMPCGQPKFSSTPSATGVFHQRQNELPWLLFAGHHQRHYHRAVWIQSRLTALISCKLVSSGRSVINSMLLRPNKRRSAP